MPFYLKKGINFGPIRLNLSKSGLGISLGTTGFRIGSGPNGNYLHMGRGGMYYRKSLPSLAALAKMGKGEPTEKAETLPHDPETGEILEHASEETAEKRTGDLTLKWHWVVPLAVIGFMAYQHWSKETPHERRVVAQAERHVAGETLSEPVRDSVDAFVAAVLEEDAKAASEHVALPFTYMRDGKPRSIRTKQGFTRNFELIFTPEYVAAIKTAKEQPMELSGASPALAGGLIHFNASGKPKHFNNF